MVVNRRNPRSDLSRRRSRVRVPSLPIFNHFASPAGRRSGSLQSLRSWSSPTTSCANLPPPPLRVLEVGCGDQGGVTPALVAAGYDVLAIDPRAPEGPSYRRITLEELESEPFDAVVAGRVLHHVTPLAPALAKLAQLAPLLMADEFAWNLIDADAQQWYERLYQERATPERSRRGPGISTNGGGATPISTPRRPCCSELDAVYETVEIEWRPYLYHWLGQETEASGTGGHRRRRAARDRVPPHLSDPGRAPVSTA